MNVKPIDSLEFAENSYQAKQEEEKDNQAAQQDNKDNQSAQNLQARQDEYNLAPALADSARTEALLNGLEDVLAPSSIFTHNIQLSDADQKALELIHQAKQGVDQWGGYVSGVLRNRS